MISIIIFLFGINLIYRDLLKDSWEFLEFNNIVQNLK